MLKGCDISYAQAVGVDISPYDFVIVRSNDGTDPDSKYMQHADNVLKAGKLLGFYLYSYPNLNRAVDEAKAMLECVKPYLGKCILALDWEGTAVSGGYPESYILEFMDYIYNTTGIKPFFYTFASALSGAKYPNVAKKYPLWVAHWGADTPSIGIWDKWTIWQYQGDPFDLDNFDGTKQDWQNWCGKISGEWVIKNAYLSESEKANNAELVWKYFEPKGWTLNAVAAILGNMEKESTINPGIWESLTPWGDPDAHGFGLVQWTPYTRITQWMQSHGYEIDNGDGQCAKLLEECEHPEIEVTWIETAEFPISFKEFVHSSESPGALAQVFLYNYERPSDLNQPDRSELAAKWYNYLRGFVFEPRLTQAGMEGSPYWYSDGNPFYAAGFGLPNCTCYAWGRWWEITGERPTKLSLGNGNTWWERSIANGVPHGSTPQLGAIVCFWYSDDDGGGHVAVVEQINADGSIVTSNSAWGGTYFYTQTLYPPDYKTANGWPSYGYVQGFLYLDSTVRPPDPPEPPIYVLVNPNFIGYLKPLSVSKRRQIALNKQKRSKLRC